MKQLHVFDKPADEERPQNLGTPEALYADLEEAFGGHLGFVHDVCAEPWNAKAPFYLDADLDALSVGRSWRPTGASALSPRFYDSEWPLTQDYNVASAINLCSARKDLMVWCNPPYNDIETWVARGLREVQSESILGVCFLIPNRSEREWWRRLVIPNAWHIEQIEGRVAFEYPPGEEKKMAPFEPSVAVVFRRHIKWRR